MSSQPPPPPSGPREPFRIPPAPKPNVWRRFRAAPLWAQILAWGATAFITLIVLGLALGDPQAADQSADRASSAPAATTTAGNLLDSAGSAATTASTPAPAPEPAPTPPPEDVDTGRMSTGEFEFSSQLIEQANDEITAYGEALGGECAALFSALEAAAAIDCVKEGYDGVEGDLGGVVAQMERVRGDVAKRCRAAVDRVYKVANVPLFQALRASRDAFVSIDAPAARRTSRKLQSEITRWARVVLEFRAECAPA